MVSEMESVKNVANNSVNNSAYMPNSSPQPVHSPQSVGIEFVRQYYTMLNRAPQLLFRFYSDDSTFVHGCLDKHGEAVQYVRGQKQINQKILALNFKNCHTKIRQVDSMETIGNGVVIQVIGELSNNGQPLRRFLQTFVLTPQTPNKYYVRNDIFRYQDEFYLEENEDPTEKNDIESKNENSIEVENLQPTESSEKDFSYQSNGTINNVIEEHVSSVEESVVNQEETESIQESSIEANTSLIDVTEAKEQLDEEDEIESVSDTATNTSQLFNEPKTYASMLSKNFQSGPAPSLNSNKPAPVAVSVTSVVVNVNNEIGNVIENPVVNPSVNKNAGFPPQRDRFSKKGGFNKRNESRESVKNNDSDSGDGENPSNSGVKKFPDDHQLFIGNLLPNFCEDDLLNIFARYGKILEVRINRQSHKTNSNKANRNYGFITFEEPNVVDQIIAQKPIYHGNHRYNVEKKQGKSGNYERNRNNQNNSPRNGSQSNAPNPPPGAPARHMQVNTGGQGNPGQQRPRAGQNYNAANNAGNRNFSGGQNYNNRNAFNHQQNR